MQITDDLAATFPGLTFSVDSLNSPTLAVSGAYTGNGQNNLLDGTDTLAAGTSGTVEMVVTVDPGGQTGPFNNSAQAAGSSPAGTLVTDLSDAAAVVDENGNGDPTDDSDPTPVTLGEAPQIGLALQRTNGPTNNGDGTFDIRYQYLVENTGDVPLSAVQVESDLAVAFPGIVVTVVELTSTDLTVNPAYDGTADRALLAGTDTLAVGGQGTFELLVRITPAGSNGPFNLSGTARGTSPGGTVVTDVSDNAATVDENGNGDPTDDNDPTPVVISPDGAIGLAKQASASTPNFDGTYTTTITLTVTTMAPSRSATFRLRTTSQQRLPPRWWWASPTWR